MKLASVSLALLALAVAPAAAQTPAPSPNQQPSATTTPGGTGTNRGTTGAGSRSDCEVMWRAADRNSDGRLDKAEIDASKTSMPGSLSNASSATQQEFMAACTRS